MQPGRDPVERADDEGRDLYEVATWEPRSRVDRLVVGLDRAARLAVRVLQYALAALIGLAVFGLSGWMLYVLFDEGSLSAVTDPVVAALVALSVVPALILAGYVWRSDVTTGEPLSLIVVTFLLAVLLAGLAVILNSLSLYALGVDPRGLTPLLIVYFYLVVGPVEEGVKLLAVRLHAFRQERFDAVIDGAVYGAVAGLGFATIENAVYITGSIESVATVSGVLDAASGRTASRMLAGPGHVIYSSITGFYLGLAKFNREYAVPLVLKGLLVAAVIHGTYNVGVSTVPGVLAYVTPLSGFDAVLVFVVAFDTVAGYYLYRKLRRYRDAYRAVDPESRDRDPVPELTEFESAVEPAPGGTDDGAVLDEVAPRVLPERLVDSATAQSSRADRGAPRSDGSTFGGSGSSGPGSDRSGAGVGSDGSGGGVEHGAGRDGSGGDVEYDADPDDSGGSVEYDAARDDSGEEVEYDADGEAESEPVGDDRESEDDDRENENEDDLGDWEF